MPLVTCEAEALTREILKAQNSLLDLTPSGRNTDAIVTQAITTTQSPTMSKLKRRQTMGGPPDSNKKRVLKTYGAKTSKDDFDFHGSSDEGGDIVSRKRQMYDDGSAGQLSSKGRHEKESYTLGSSASNDPLHERQDAGLENVITADIENDMIVTAASRAKKGRAMSLSVVRDLPEVATLKETSAEHPLGSNEIPLGDTATKKKRSRRRLTTHSSSPAAQQDASVIQTEMMSRGASTSNVLETAVSEIGGRSRASPEVLSLALYEPYVHSNSTTTSTEMLPPLVKHALAFHLDSDHSCPSTVPNTTPAEPSQAESKLADEHSYLRPLSWSTSARMTSPTVAGSSNQESEYAFEHSVSANINGESKPPGGSANIQVAEEDVTINSALQPSPPARGRRQPPGLLATDLGTTQELAPEVKDELSKPSATHEGSGTSLQKSQPLKGKLKRKTQDNIHTDELGSDDIAVGLPKEQYQPRPSRSRANRADEEFLLAVDFSKRPEVVAKVRIKRRRTTGGHIPTHEDVTVDSFSELGDDEAKALRKTKTKRPKATGDQDPPCGTTDIVDPPQHDTDGTEMHGEEKATSFPTEKEELEETVNVVDDNNGNDLDDAIKPVEKSEEPKKKRGRPRKKTTEEPLSFPEPSNDNPPALPAANTENPTKPPPVKKPAKRRKTNDTTTTQISEERVVSDNEDLHLGADDASHDDPKIPSLLPLDSPPREPKPTAPVQTPQKKAPKGPDKHSPLNSGKVPYRVGLSKKARIEPLLRIVRK